VQDELHARLCHALLVYSYSPDGSNSQAVRRAGSRGALPHIKFIFTCLSKKPRWKDIIELNKAGLSIVVVNLLNTLVEERKVPRAT